MPSTEPAPPPRGDRPPRGDWLLRALAIAALVGLALGLFVGVRVVLASGGGPGVGASRHR